MENLILNIVQNYFIIGVVFAVVLDIFVRSMKASAPSTFLEIFAIMIAWPVVIGTVVIGFINKNI